MTLVRPSLPEVRGYRLVEKLGEGGTGEVFRAEHLASSRPVAIKFLAPRGDDRDHERIDREGRLMASLDHPHIVRIHDWGEIDGRCFLVMEFVDGPTLRQTLTPAATWSLCDAAILLDATAQALAYIHSRGVLHLDLKPENVLLQAREGTPGNVGGLQPAGRRGAPSHPSGCWIPKLTDFGLAVPRLAQPAAPELSLIQGSIDYCAPELRYGLPFDVRSDVFALATVAYEVLTGRLPGRVFYPASRRNARLPSSVDAVLARGLARDPDERYPSVEAFRIDLGRRLEEACLDAQVKTAP